MCVCVSVNRQCYSASLSAVGDLCCVLPLLLPELYIDEKKKCYEDLNYKRFNFVNIWAALVSAITRRTSSNVSCP